jgi:rare lipoprotein A
VVVNDRGPYVGNRIMDLSQKAAAVLGFTRTGLAQIAITAMPAGPAT